MSAPMWLPLLFEAKQRLQKSEIRVLDIGCGRGSAAIITKAEYGDQFRLDGIEPFHAYVSEDMKSLYGMIRHEMIENVYESLEGWDIFLMLDVVEHLDFEIGKKIISKLSEKGIVIVSLPMDESKFHRQDPGFERANPLEAHRHAWKAEELEAIGFRVIGNNAGIGVAVKGM